MKLAALCFLLPASAVWADGLGYFPLDAGDIWVYETSGSRCCTPLVVEVTDTATFDGNSYFLLHSSAGGDYWLRATNDGAVISYAPQAGRESLWYNFQTPEGQPFSTAIPYCCGQAAVASRDTTYSGPTGSFDGALTMTYPGGTDDGLAREIFAPGVGLMQRIENTGDLTVAAYQLVYARVGRAMFRPAAIAPSGIAGRISRGPVCPVQVPGDPACADQPFETVITIKTPDGRDVTITASDGNGYFHVFLPPGDYVVASENVDGSKFPRAVSQTVTVLANGIASVTLRADTGIR